MAAAGAFLVSAGWELQVQAHWTRHPVHGQCR